MTMQPQEIPFLDNLDDVPETRPYWEACNNDTLLLTRCKDTGKTFSYPRGVSPFTLSDNIEWFEASGRGAIYSFSRVESAKPPYTIAYVSLDEGVTILTGLVGFGPDGPRIGQSVKVVFQESVTGQKAPFFAPG